MTKIPDDLPADPPTGYRTSAVTRAKLVEAAGELFAESGFEGTSTRAIADKAGVKLGGIHYHFGGKEALYLAAFRRVCFGGGEESPVAALAEAFAHDPARPERTAAHILELVRRESRWVLAMDRPAWESRLLMRGIAERTPATMLLVREIFAPAHRRWVRLHQQVRPADPPEEAELWSLAHAGFIVLYNLARETVALVLDRPRLDGCFIDRAIDRAARERILTLGLPLPPELERS